MAEPTSMEKPTMAGNRNSINPADLFEKVFPSKKDIECFVCKDDRCLSKFMTRLLEEE